MIRQSKTFRDRMMFALAILPPSALLLFCVSAAAKWQTESTKIRPMLEREFSPEVIAAPSPNAVAYAARTSKEKSKAFGELQSAISVLNAKYDLMFELIDVQPAPNQNMQKEREIDRYVDDYLAEARPILDSLSQLQPDLSKIWMPNELGNPDSYSSGLVNSRNMFDMLAAEFEAAVRTKETERALRALHLDTTLISQAVVMDLDKMLSRVAGSLTTGIWSEQELIEIEQSIANRSDFDRDWRRLFRPSQLEQTQWLLYGKNVDSWRPDPIEFTYAPSHRIAWFQHMQAFSTVNGIGTVAALKKVMQIESDWYDESKSGLDAALQVPTYGQFNQAGVNASYFAKSLVGKSNDLRWVRTAVAIAKYKLKFDSYPDSLADLNKVGLAESESLDPAGYSFSYSKYVAGCSLGNASMHFSSTPSIALFDGQEQILASTLGSYRSLFFPAR